MPVSGVCAIGQHHRRSRLCEDAVVFQTVIDWVSGEWWSYPVIFAVAMIDAFFPLVPSETLAITGGVLAGSGDLSLPLVIVAASTGAIIGDNISYFLGHWLGEHTVKRVFRGEKSHKAFAWAESQLETRGMYLIVIARFIPGGRTAVTFSAGYIQTFPWRKFIVADVLAGLIWGTYTATLGYIGGKSFEDHPTLALLGAFAAAISVTAVIELVRHVRARRRGPTIEPQVEVDITP
jgi:membrane-associated protein